jgi:hypothetical protein
MFESAYSPAGLSIKAFGLTAVVGMIYAAFDAQVPIQASAQTAIPELATSGFAWQAFGADWRDPPAGLRGPIKPHPKHPYHGNNDGPGQVTVRIGNDTDPVLKSWAAQQMRESNEEILTGKRAEGFMAQSRCYPGGVPGQLLYVAEPVYFIQRPTQVLMVWQRDHMVRRIYLIDKHSPDIDNWRTPHSEQLHVIERFKPSADKRTLEALVRVEDPGAFTEPLFMVQMWRRVINPLAETVCAENNVDFFNQNLIPIPKATRPDF